MNHAFYRVSALVGLSVLLLGCSSEPSEADIKAAVQAQYDAVNSLSGMFGMKKDIANLTSVEKVGCSSVRDKVFRCDVVVTGGNAITGEGKSTASLLLMKTKEGWAEVEQ
jgi:outer membrane lipoprotein-sorting protein